MKLSENGVLKTGKGEIGGTMGMSAFASTSGTPTGDTKKANDIRTHTNMSPNIK